MSGSKRANDTTYARAKSIADRKGKDRNNKFRSPALLKDSFQDVSAEKAMEQMFA